MNQTDHLPYENIRVKEIAEGLDFDADVEGARRIFFQRVKDVYLRDRHLIPGPAQIILDVTIQEIEDLITQCGYSRDVFTETLCFPRMLTLVREIIALQATISPFPAGGVNPNSICRN